MDTAFIKDKYKPKLCERREIKQANIERYQIVDPLTQTLHELKLLSFVKTLEDRKNDLLDTTYTQVCLAYGLWNSVKDIGFPVEDGNYLLTICSDYMQETVTFGYWDGETVTEADSEEDITDIVIAWMPLPEPYKEE